MAEQQRQEIITLCAWALKSRIYWNQIGFDHIAKDYGQGSGTTCGFLPHWLLWRLGCSDATLVNRSSPAQGFKWRTGRNLEIFTKHPSSVVVDGVLAKIMAGVDGSKDAEVDKALKAGRRGPKPGEFIIIRGTNWKNKTTGVRDRDSAHIFVLLGVEKADGTEVRWRAAQTGISTYAQGQGGEIATLTGKLRDGDMVEGPESSTPKKGPHLVFKAEILGEEPNFPRRVTTFTDLDKVSFGLPPDKDFTDLFDKRWPESATNNWTMIAPWLGWYEETNPGGYITMAPSYLLLERGHEATRFAKVGGLGAYRVETKGAWTRNRDRLAIEWAKPPGGPAAANGWSQAWSLARTFVPRDVTIGTPLTQTAGTLSSLKQLPPQVPPEWAGAHFIGS